MILDNGKLDSEIIRSLDIECNISTNTRYFSGERSYNWHSHDTSTITFITQGGAEEVRKNGSQIYGVGSIFFYPAGEHHQTYSGRDVSKSIMIEFDEKFFNRFNYSKSHLNEVAKENADAKLLMLSIQKELYFGDFENQTSIQTLILDLIGNSKRRYTGKLPKWVYLLTELLNDRWNENLTLAELSKEVGVHPITISKHFRKYFFCTYGEYVQKLRVNKSIYLIKNSEVSLTEIAQSCGFADHSHFTRTFKHITQLLPKDFRNL